jgi:DNA-binding protein WhiA
MLRQLGVKAGSIDHHGGVTVYIKRQEDIVRVLAAMGAHRALLEMESIRVVRAVKNQVNRLVNSETANLARTVESGVEQARLLARLVEDARWQALPTSLVIVAQARLEHPDWSLKEIGQALVPPLSKSAVNHRMRKLLSLVQEAGLDVEPWPQ